VVKRSVQRPEPNAADAGESKLSRDKSGEAIDGGHNYDDDDDEDEDDDDDEDAVGMVAMVMQWAWLVVMQWHEPVTHFIEHLLNPVFGHVRLKVLTEGLP
jgi:hypothetical protein